ncbi:MAG TPA: hypothetical protein VF317_06350 [Dermatophilaceae bacterium]
MSEWNTVAFAPAPPGWCAHFAEGADRWSMPIAGWLTQEDGHARRFIAAFANAAGELVPLDLLGAASSLAAIRGPGGIDRGALSAGQLRDALGAVRWAVAGSEANYAAVDPVATSTQSEVELGGQIERTAHLLRQQPKAGRVSVPSDLAEIERLTANVAEERERLAAAASVDKGNRWRRSDPVVPPRSPAILEGITARLEEAHRRLSEAQGEVAARAEWDAEHASEIARGVAARDELAWRQRARQVLSWPSTLVEGPGLGLLERSL